MSGPVAATLSGGRLHLQHGPIDLIIGVDDPYREAAFRVAWRRFETVLSELVEELPLLRQPLSVPPKGDIARRMFSAALPFSGFRTPMIAVAGAVADDVLAAMTETLPLQRAYVNNGGDISVHLTRGTSFEIAMASGQGAGLGRVTLTDRACGLATSGAGGRSFSRGVADSVTVLANTAARADAAATLIANAIDLPNHPGIKRQPARALQPDSDLGEHLVTTHVPPLNHPEREEALNAGKACAEEMQRTGLIKGAALFLQGASCFIGPALNPALSETVNV